MMNEKFLKLSPDRQQEIYQAICEEFTEHSYDDASTNRIMTRANLSKGTLFNYFGCKEKMYHGALDHAMNFFKKHEVQSFKTRDFIERCRILAELDMKIYQEAPYMMNFLAKLYVGDKSHLPEEFLTLFTVQLGEALDRLYLDVDITVFRQDVDPITLMQLIRYTFDGYLKDITGKIQAGVLNSDVFETFIQEFDDFLVTLKTICYQ